MNTTRRDFLKGSISAGAALPVAGATLAPSWLQAMSGQAAAAGKILVVLQVRGGWDWLNLLIPADSSTYYTARPNIGIPKASTLGAVQSSSVAYWHPSMLPFKQLFDGGRLAVIQGIGYPQPNLSHFESEKKWYAADLNVVLVDKGWLGAYLKTASNGTQIPALDLEGSQTPAFNGALVPVLTNPATFRYTADAGTPGDNVTEIKTLVQNAMFLRPSANANLKFVASGIVGANNDSLVLQNTGSAYAPAVTYPVSGLSTTLRLAARYIIYGLPTQVYYLNTGGYDTHANEVVNGAPATGTIANLIAGVTGSVKAFLDDVKAQAPARAQDVIVMLFSEFGRRTGQNGSIGTDHGHQSMAFVAGEGVVGGLYGTYPDMTKAIAPYANHYFGYVPGQTTDFRSLYATVLEKWLVVPSAPILGAQFPLIPCL